MSEHEQEQPEKKPKKKRRRGAGEGTVEQLPGGSWRATIWMGKNPVTGKPLRYRQTFPTQKEANQWRIEKIAELNQGKLVTPDKSTLGEWLKAWLVSKELSLEKKTWLRYEVWVREHVGPRIGHVRLCELTPEAVESFHADMAKTVLSAGTRHKIAKMLKQALREAVRRRKLASNPADLVEMVKYTPPEMKYLNQDEVDRLLDNVEGEKFAALFWLAVDSGMRLGEMLALYWTDFDWPTRTVNVVRSLREVKGHTSIKDLKTGAKGRRRIELSPETIAELRKLQDSRPGTKIVFASRTGGHVLQSNLHKGVFKRVIGKNGVPKIRFHDLRHTCATLLLMDGVFVSVVQQRLGHTTPVITLTTYAHVMPSMQSQAAESMSRILGRRAKTETPKKEGCDGEGEVAAG